MRVRVRVRVRGEGEGEDSAVVLAACQPLLEASWMRWASCTACTFSLRRQQIRRPHRRIPGGQLMHARPQPPPHRLLAEVVVHGGGRLPEQVGGAPQSAALGVSTIVEAQLSAGGAQPKTIAGVATAAEARWSRVRSTMSSLSRRMRRSYLG